MAQTVKLRRSATPGAIPTTAQLELGEIAINTADGKIYIKQDVSGVESIVEFSADSNDLLTLIKTVDGADSGLDADLLDGQQGSYYTNYNNLSNTPTTLSAFTNNIYEVTSTAPTEGTGYPTGYVWFVI